jgi:hypothetical protein
MAKRSTGKRELIDTGRNKMFAKRDAGGQFKEMDDVGRSLATGSPDIRQDRLEGWAWGPRRPPAKGDEEEVATQQGKRSRLTEMGRLSKRLARRAAERRVAVEGERRRRGRGAGGARIEAVRGGRRGWPSPLCGGGGWFVRLHREPSS